jgi:predicted DNA-binding protein (MmcQ/YjbR family)
VARKNIGKILTDGRGKSAEISRKKFGKLENSAPRKHKFSRKNTEYLDDLANKNHSSHELGQRNMTHEELETYLLSMPNSRLDFPFGEETAVYKTFAKNGDEKMFAIIPLGKTPLQVSLKCDPELARDLREKYESVLPGYHLNKKHWNTLLLTGQLDDEFVKDLIRLSWRLVSE